MTQETLHRLRYLIPGVLLLLAALSVVLPGPEFLERLGDKELKDYTLPGVAWFLVALLYYVLELRKHIGFLTWDPVRTNIRNRLLKLLPALATDEQRYLSNERRIIDVFYKLVDSDESQRAKQMRVRFNGLIVSSCHDIVASAMLGASAHAAALFVRNDYVHLWWAGILVALAVVTKFLLARLAMARHIELSNEQIDFISDHQLGQLHQIAQDVLQGLRNKDTK